MKIFLLLFLITTFICWSQVPYEKTTIQLKEKLSSVSDDSKVLVWVFFKDKGERLNKFYEAPKNVVSELSLKRRAKTLDKSSLIDFTDLPVCNEYISGLQKQGFELNQISRWFNGVSGYITKKDYNNLLLLPYVQSTDIVIQYEKEPELKTTAPELNTTAPELNKISPESVQTNVLNYGPSLTQDQQINIPALQNLGYNGQGVTICMMDDGVTLLSHKAFASMHIIATYDFVNHRVYIGDGQGGMGIGNHGTETLSTIGGYYPGVLIGPAYGANYLITKTENSQSNTPLQEDNWIAAMEWADSIGVDITSSSLSHLFYISPYPSYSWQSMDGHKAKITQGCLMAARKGIIVVNSAGNDGFDPSHNTLGVPADADSIITTGADSSNGLRADFSSVGPTVDGRIKPDVMAMGVHVIVASPDNPATTFFNDGTSFSCPLTAGVCALLLSINPSLTNMQIRDAIRNTASNHLSPNRLIGWGLINALAAANLSTLPVEITTFSAKAVGNEIDLIWTTATENSNHGFEIQKKSNDNTFTSIGFVNGNGNTNIASNYFFEDTKPQPRLNIYRLKQIDNNGAIKFGSEVSVNFTVVDNFALYQNYPNPFNPSTTINYSLPKSGNVKLTVYNSIGNKVATIANEYKPAGNYSVQFNGSNLASGIYLYRLESDNYSAVKKFILMK
jgi:hypothetical protein